MDGSTKPFLYTNSQTVNVPAVAVGTDLIPYALDSDPILNQQIGVSQEKNLVLFQNNSLQNENHEVQPSDPDCQAQVEELWKLLSPNEPYVPIELSTSPYNPITPREIANYNPLIGYVEDPAVVNFTETINEIHEVINELVDVTSGVVGSTEPSIGFSVSNGSNASKPRKKGRSKQVLSEEQKRKLRAERNREYAKQSRLRLKLRLEQLEQSMIGKRKSNRELREKMTSYLEKLEMRINVIERAGLNRELEKEQVYAALEIMKNAIKKCVWTFQSSTSQEIPLDLSKIITF